jgi:hypothetical protein
VRRVWVRVGNEVGDESPTCCGPAFALAVQLDSESEVYQEKAMQLLREGRKVRCRAEPVLSCVPCVTASTCVGVGQDRAITCLKMKK